MLRIIDVALEDHEDIRTNPHAINDIAAYVLNRVPPRYIMSERGFSRLADSHVVDPEDPRFLVSSIQLVSLVNEAINLVANRRPAHEPDDDHPDPDELLLQGHTEAEENVHNFPQFVGRVVDITTRRPVASAHIRLSRDGQLMAQAEPGWINPYETQDSTNGVFSFWPAPDHSLDDTMQHKLVFSISCEGYEDREITELVETVASFVRFDTFYTETVENLGTIELTPR